MMEDPRLIERKYKAAMQALMEQVNVVFTLQAQLEQANQRIVVLEKAADEKNGEPS